MLLFGIPYASNISYTHGIQNALQHPFGWFSCCSGPRFQSFSSPITCFDTHSSNALLSSCFLQCSASSTRNTDIHAHPILQYLDSTIQDTSTYLSLFDLCPWSTADAFHPECNRSMVSHSLFHPTHQAREHSWLRSAYRNLSDQQLQ